MPRRAKFMFKKNKIGKTYRSDFKIYGKAIIFEMIWYQCQGI